MVSKELIQAYKQAKYIVEVKGGIELRVGKRHERLDAWLSSNDIDLAAFITPENPYSQQLTHEQNSERHKSMQSELIGRKMYFVQGFGVDDAELWPREMSYLIQVKHKQEATDIAVAYGQNAYLLCENGKITELVISA